jgi:hypothetical protein
MTLEEFFKKEQEMHERMMEALIEYYNRRAEWLERRTHTRVSKLTRSIMKMRKCSKELSLLNKVLRKEIAEEYFKAIEERKRLRKEKRKKQ